MKNNIWKFLVLAIPAMVMAGGAMAQAVQKIKVPAVDSTALVAGQEFTDSLGRKVRLSDFRGKYVLVDLWYSGCGGCITVNEGLAAAHGLLGDSRVVFVSISVDRKREVWMASITAGARPSALNPWAGKYVPRVGTVVLYTSGSGYDNPFVRQMVPGNIYPRLLLITPDGRVLGDRPPRPDNDPQALATFLRERMAKGK